MIVVGPATARRRNSIGRMMPSRLKTWARAIKRDIYALYLVARDPRAPWYVKAMALAVVGYALSPLDLIPDFIPVVGYLDDLILLPLAILLTVKLVPAEMMAEHRATALAPGKLPVSRFGAIVIVGLWVASAALLLWWIWPSVAFNASKQLMMG